MTDSAFRQDAALAACLASLNARWQERLDLFRSRSGPPWWAPGLVLTPELRARYETYLPVAAFCADLARLAELLLPHPSWVPRILRTEAGRTCAPPGADGPASLPDLWSRLPLGSAGRLAFAVEELPALFCALADPPQFGTDVERYHIQQELLTTLLSRPNKTALRVLDLACGVGAGTFAMAALAYACGRRGVEALGLTIEPLEAWMAAHQCLPHDPPRQLRLQRLADGLREVHFAAADARCLPISGPLEIILCNGLAGGPLLERDADLLRLLSECARVLAPCGWLLLSNRFHDGRRARVEHLAAVARARGWLVSGDWHDLALQWLPAGGPPGLVPSLGAD